MQLRQLIKESTETVSACYPEGEAREMVFAYLEHAFGTRKYTHIVEPEYEIQEDGVMRARADFSRMASGEPLQYVTGKAYFYGRSFNVSPSVLIPRPETEILCQKVVEECREREGLKLLDLCTGSGCIAWTLALEMPGTEVTAVDISEDALRIAGGQDFAEELSRTGASTPSFVRADVLGQPMSGPERYDVIVSNPPYVTESEKAFMRSNVLDHEPHLALFVPDDDPLIFYRAVAGWAHVMLKPGGYGIVEINEAFASDTEEIFRNLDFVSVQTIRDLHEKDRFVTFRKGK